MPITQEQLNDLRDLIASVLPAATREQWPTLWATLVEIADDQEKLVSEVERLREALRPCAGWLEYAYGNVSSVTSEKVKAHLPKIKAALPQE
jgi:hypothetical protein